MNDKPYKKKVSISLDEDIVEKIKLLAERDDRSFSQYINMVLRKWIQKDSAPSLKETSLYL